MESMLTKLAQERDNLLLGEVAALLHEMSKLDRNFILSQLKMPLINPTTGKRANYTTFANVPMDDSSITISPKQKERFSDGKNNQLFVWDDLEEPQKIALRNYTTTLCGEKYTLPELLAFWHWLDGKEFLSAINYSYKYERNEVEYRNWLVDRHGYALWLLDACHGKVQVDKAIKKGDGIQQRSPLWISSAFGYEYETFVADDLTMRLKRLVFSNMGTASKQAHNEAMENVREHFAHGLGDTQRPINEITLWDWSWSTATLYKSALARLMLEYRPFDINVIPSALKSPLGWKWRTLRVTVDVLGLLAHGQRISDVLGYRQAIDEMFYQVKELIEVTYPLGNELYRDSTGIYFSFPGFADKSAELATVRMEITDALSALPIFKWYPELTPEIAIGEAWGEHDGDPKWQDARRMLADQQQASKRNIESGAIASRIPWQSLWPLSEPQEVCPVCGIRPIAKPKMGIEGEKLPYRTQRCSNCDDRAKKVRQQWADDTTHSIKRSARETIWLDEIADEHDRVALIVGRFQLDHWLDGTMVSTLAGSIPKDGQAQTKQPSPARIMRIWRTTEEFWTKSVDNLLISHFEQQRAADLNRPLMEQQRRFQRWLLHIPGLAVTGNESVLDGTVDGQPISLMPKRDANYLTISNLDLCKGIVKDGAEVRVRADNGPWLVGTIAGEPQVPTDLATYYPIRTILTSPDQFLALVPGADALEIAKQIAAQYACEMGKVRSRLPLDLALVYFHRKMPLYAVMDAARRFLTQKPGPEKEREPWIVPASHTQKAMPITFTNGVQWDIPTTFGDGCEDDFYPYVALADGCQPREKRHYAVDETQPDGQVSKRVYTHVRELGPGDTILVTPSHFSYLWLDSSARRYDAGYVDEDVPFATQGLHLEEIGQLMALWEKLQTAKKMGQMTGTKLHGIVEMLLEKKLAWKDDPSTFNTFAKAVADRQKSGSGITAEDITSGRLFRCFDLHHRIMKSKLEQSTSTKEA